MRIFHQSAKEHPVGNLYQKDLQQVDLSPLNMKNLIETKVDISEFKGNVLSNWIYWNDKNRKGSVNSERKENQNFSTVQLIWEDALFKFCNYVLTKQEV